MKALALASLALMACITEPRKNQAAPPAGVPMMVALLDPCTGKDVGVKDLTTDEYQFHDGTTIDAVDIEPIEEDRETCTADAAGKQCWVMYESSIDYVTTCYGCCANNGDGSYSCWERCSATSGPVTRIGETAPTSTTPPTEACPPPPPDRDPVLDATADKRNQSLYFPE